MPWFCAPVKATGPFPLSTAGEGIVTRTLYGVVQFSLITLLRSNERVSNSKVCCFLSGSS